MFCNQEKDFAGPACTLCELIVQTVDTYLMNNKSEAAINATVYKVCNSLPASLKDMVCSFCHC
jgi:saposin